jgi:flagellar hook-length control protein FliK
MAGEQNRGGNSQSQNKPETPANESAATILDEIAAGRAIASNGLLSLFA